MKICKSCGIEITDDEDEMFNGYCCNCDEINNDMIDEMNHEDIGE